MFRLEYEDLGWHFIGEYETKEEALNEFDEIEKDPFFIFPIHLIEEVIIKQSKKKKLDTQ